MQQEVVTTGAEETCEDCGRRCTRLHYVDGNVNYHEDRKKVCRDACVYTCPNGHCVYSTCPTAFEGLVRWDEDYDRDTFENIMSFQTHIDICLVCGSGCLITRQFYFESAQSEIKYRVWRYKHILVLQRWWRRMVFKKRIE